MLIQQGLEEIANVSTSEQIAFLLVERARLLDELEAEQNRTMTPSVDGRASEDLQRTLDKERNEFEEEIAQHRDNLKKTKEQMKRQHEEEINALMEENNKLEDDLVESKEKVSIIIPHANKVKVVNSDIFVRLLSILTAPPLYTQYLLIGIGKYYS